LEGVEDQVFGSGRVGETWLDGQRVEHVLFELAVDRAEFLDLARQARRRGDGRAVVSHPGPSARSPRCARL
jgi:hypothetical protein